MNRSVFKVVWNKGKPVSIKAEVVSETFNGWMKLQFPNEKPFSARLSADGWRPTIADAWAWAIEVEARIINLETMGIVQAKEDPALSREKRIQRIVDCAYGAMEDINGLCELVAEIKEKARIT